MNGDTEFKINEEEDSILNDIKLLKSIYVSHKISLCNVATIFMIVMLFLTVCALSLEADGLTVMDRNLVKLTIMVVSVATVAVLKIGGIPLWESKYTIEQIEIQNEEQYKVLKDSGLNVKRVGKYIVNVKIKHK